MKNTIICIVLILAMIFSILVLSSCGNDVEVENYTDSPSTLAPSTNSVEEYNQEAKYEIKTDSYHYLIFCVDGREIGRMYVTDKDTYNSLKPYFPTIPTKNGQVGEWEELEKVYDSKNKEITINAVITYLPD